MRLELDAPRTPPGTLSRRGGLALSVLQFPRIAGGRLLIGVAAMKADQVAHGLIQGYVGPDHRVINIESFYRALVQALKAARHQTEEMGDRAFPDLAEAKGLLITLGKPDKSIHRALEILLSDYIDRAREAKRRAGDNPA